MKRKDFLHTAIILPVILGLALCVAFSLFFYLRPQTILPFEQGKTFAYFDETEPSGAPYKKNETVGKLEIGSSIFDLKYDADFSQLGTALSLKKESNLPGETGCLYAYALGNSLKTDAAADEIVLTTANGEQRFALDKTVTASSENEVLSLAPDCKNSLVVYYEKMASVGFSSKYTTHIYKGVQ